MFKLRLLSAFLLVGLVSLSLGAVAYWLTGISQDRLAQSRRAGDIVTGFVDLSAAEQRLRYWSLRMLLAPAPMGEDVASRIAAKRAILDELRRLNAATLRGEGAEAAADRARRAALLDELDGAVARIEAELASAATLGPEQAPAAIEAIFRTGANPDLAALLAGIVAQERANLEAKRVAADETLRNIRLIVVMTTLALIAVALVLYAYLAAALRRPLADLEAGAEALARGDLAHRLPEQGRDEFARFARGVNRMAEEVAGHRAREADVRHRLEVEVRRRTSQLDEALQDLRCAEARRLRLLADLSHDLRTPTTAIRGEAEVTLRGAAKPVEEYREALTRILAAARQMGALLNELLHMARGGEVSGTRPPEAVDITETLSEAIAHGRGLALDRGIAVEAALDPVPDTPLVMGDGQRLLQMLTNLVENAIHYSRDGGTVRVAAGVDVDGAGVPVWTARIEDDGIGIAPDELPHVFDRHYRGAGAIDHRPHGSGLGLAIARSAAEQHGGEIRLDSTPGQGTRVRIVLPLLPATQDTPPWTS